MMRVASLYVLAVGIGLGLMAAHPAAAQSPLEGPLASPDAVLGAQPKPAKPKPARKKPAKTAQKAPPKADGQPYDPAAAPASRPVVQTGRALPDQPLSFGMKWNGSNDDARETRIQNYNGDAPGTGAEVGMKLHF